MGQIRITGGSHRSRKITVKDQPGLRPTGDRIRETLFNWLGHNLTDMHVLDLYAGSGILAFEAASRNASSVICVDNNKQTIKQLQDNSQALELNQINISLQDAKNYVQNSEDSFDLIFLDPPFDSDEMNTISAIISPLCKTHGYLYRESRISQDVPPLDDLSWRLHKQKQAGQVCFELWQKQ